MCLGQSWGSKQLTYAPNPEPLTRVVALVIATLMWLVLASHEQWFACCVTISTWA